MGNPVEIDEVELVALRNAAKLLNTSLQGKGREQLLRAIKMDNPTLPIPELDARAPVDEAMNGIRDDMKALRDQISAEKTAREDAENRAKLANQWNEGRSKANKMGYTGESLEALEKFMEEKGVADHEVAAAAFEKLHPQATPVVSQSGRFSNDFFSRKIEESDHLNKMLFSGDFDGHLNGAIDQTLKDIRGAA